MAGRMRVKMTDRWREHLTACFRRGVEAYKDHQDRDACPYVGQGVNLQRRKQWIAGWNAGMKADIDSDLEKVDAELAAGKYNL